MKLNKQRMSILAAGIMLAVLAAPASAWTNKEEKALMADLKNQVNELRARLDRSERLLESANIQQMYMRLQTMDEENRLLRGSIEELGYKLDQQQQRERELNLDMDKRLQEVESRSTSMSSGQFGSGGYTGATIQDGESAPAYESATAALDEQGMYGQAFDYLKSGLYQPSIEGFNLFLQTYPDSTLAANAQYWLGEANYGAGNFEKSVNDFQNVITGYSGSAKEPDASLKLGYAYYELKRWSSARSVLQEVSNKFPGSSVSKLADDRLARMKSEGH